ncbi:MAG: hypothetical protein U0Q22_03175 [Acidimicrobiales bacterium]
MRCIGIVRRRHAARTGEEGFALIATLLILGVCSLIIVALLSYAMITVQYAADQSLRDRQVQAADGAMKAFVNQLANDDSDRLGQPSLPCTPNLQANPNPLDDYFNYTVNGIPIQVKCEALTYTGQPNVNVADVQDVVDVVGTSAAGTATDCTTDATIACPKWTAALSGTGKTAADATADGGVAKTITHSGPGALWFTANFVKNAGGTAAVRDTGTCSSDETAKNQCPAVGVTGTYLQGGVGLFKNLGGSAANNLACGVLQEGSSVKLTQVVTAVANRTLCSNAGGAAVANLGSDVLPPAPTDSAGDIVGSPGWVQLHRVTQLAFPSVKFSDYVDANGNYKMTSPTVPEKPCPAGARLELSPGAYTYDAMVVLNKWMFGKPFCTNKVFWFKPGYYWFDVNDANAPSDPAFILTHPGYDPEGAKHQLTFADNRNFYVFGALPVATGQESTYLSTMTDDTPLPLCDKTKAGVSITLSPRTTIQHLRGRVGICGMTNKPALYQGNTAFTGWSTTPSTVQTGVRYRNDGNSGRVSDMSNGFANLFNSNQYTNVSQNNVGSGSTGRILRCDHGGWIEENGSGGWDYAASVWTLQDNDLDRRLYTFCESQTMAKFGPGAAWGTNTRPPHTPIASASLELSTQYTNATADSWDTEPSTAIGVFLNNRATTGVPDCAVYYKGLPNGSSYDLMDENHRGSRTIPSCAGVIKYADDLYDATAVVAMTSSTDCDYMSNSLSIIPPRYDWKGGGCGVNYGISNIASARLVASVAPAGLALRCSGQPVDTASGTPKSKSVDCTDKVVAPEAGMRMATTFDLISNRNSARVHVQCWDDWDDGGFWGPANSSWEQDRCGSPVNAAFDYQVNDALAPTVAALTDGSNPARQISSLSVTVAGSFWCRKDRSDRGPGYPSSCGPQLQSKRYNNTDPEDFAPVAGEVNNADPNFPNFYRYKNWGELNSTTMTAQVIDPDNGSVMCSGTAPISNHDEPRLISFGLTAACRNADKVSRATIHLALSLSRPGVPGGWWITDLIDFFNKAIGNCAGGYDNGDFCHEWSYNLSGMTLSAVTASASPEAAFPGPPRPNRITQGKQNANNVNDARFNVYGQMVMPKAGLTVVWDGPGTGLPIIQGPGPAGQPTLVIKSIASMTGTTGRPGFIDVPAVGVICCSKYTQSVREVRLTARLLSSATNNPQGVVGTAVVDATDVADQAYPKIQYVDWQLCNKAKTAVRCST